MSRFARWGYGPATPVRTALALETLSDRLVPTVAPQIVDFSVMAIGGGVYRFSGTVIDDQSTYGLTVEFSGLPASVNGARTDVAIDGSFALQVALANDGSDTGTVWASTEDYDFLTSVPVSVYVDPV